jgi:hypothetical protein
VYRLYGKPDAIAFRESTTGHGYQEDKRVQLYRWLDRWFFDGKMPHGESDLPYRAEPREALLVGLPEDNLSIAGLAERWVKEAIRDVPLPARNGHAERRGRRQLGDGGTRADGRQVGIRQIHPPVPAHRLRLHAVARGGRG